MLTPHTDSEGSYSYDSDDESSHRYARRSDLSPVADDASYDYSEGDSFYDRAQVEAELTEVDDEIQETLDLWSPSPDIYPSTGRSLFDRNQRVLSTISEHTENISSRPPSFAPGSRPVTQYSTHGGAEHVRRSTLVPPIEGPSSHARSTTDPSTRPQTPGRGVTTLIAQFEARNASPFAHGHTRTASAPAGPRSPSPYAPAIPFSQTMPATAVGLGLGATTSGLGSISGYGSAAGYNNSRSSSPTKGRMGSMVSGPRALSSVSGSSDSRRTPGAHSRSQSEVSGYSDMPSRSETSTFTGLTGSMTETTTATPTATTSTITLRRPQGSPRSPLTQVKNVVSAFKAKTPVLRKTQPSSPTPSEGRPRRGRRSMTPSVGGPRERPDDASSDLSPGAFDTTPRMIGVDGPGDITPPPIDVSQLGEDGEVSFLFGSRRSLELARAYCLGPWL